LAGYSVTALTQSTVQLRTIRSSVRDHRELGLTRKCTQTGLSARSAWRRKSAERLSVYRTRGRVRRVTWARSHPTSNCGRAPVSSPWSMSNLGSNSVVARRVKYTSSTVMSCRSKSGWSALPVDVRCHAVLAVKGGVRDAHLRPAAVSRPLTACAAACFPMLGQYRPTTAEHDHGAIYFFKRILESPGA
jgi:hypothetical protein